MNKNGSVTTKISPIENEDPGQSSEEKVADSAESNGFADNLLKIQKAASKLVAIQQVVKASGKISDEEKKVYAENLNTLGQAAQELSKMNEGAEDDDFRRLITGTEKTTEEYATKKNKFPDFPPFKGEEKEDVGEENGGLYNGFDKDLDTVQVNSPGNGDGSVAEAKPVGLAIAGMGGVASAKPSATAVVGPGGLAIARPSAIAIAGVSPEDVSSIGIPIPQKKIIKKNYSGLASRTAVNMASPETGKYRSTMLQTPYGDIKILIGPDYQKLSSSSVVDETTPKITDGQQTKAIMDYSQEMITKSESGDEILAEEDQESSGEKSLANDKQMGANGAVKYDDLMAVAPLDNILNLYPLAPPKFSGYSPLSRNSHKQGNNYGFNPVAAYYQNLPLYANPYNYPYPSLPYPPFYGY